MKTPTTPLTPVQEQVIAAIAAGSNQSAAAEAAGIHRNTISHWRKTSAEFRDSLSRAQYEKAVFYREQAEPLMQLAMEGFRNLLSDPHTPASVRFKTAQFVFEKASTPPPPEHTVRAEPQVPVSVLEKILFPPYASSVETGEVETSDVQTGEKSEIVHKIAQSPAAPVRRDHPKTGRNDVCPCGSGKKFKRCCIGHPYHENSVGQPISTAAA
jgi:hypothetical protein